MILMKISTFFLTSVCLFFTSTICFGQEEGKRAIQGVVYDSDTGDVLIGANILIQGTANGTVTDIHGHFHLDVPRDIEVLLEVSYCGTPVVVRVKERKSFYQIDIARFNTENRLRIGGGLLRFYSDGPEFRQSYSLGILNEGHFKPIRRANLVLGVEYKVDRLRNNGSWGFASIPLHLKGEFRRVSLEVGPSFSQVIHKTGIEREIQSRFITLEGLIAFRLSYKVDIGIGVSYYLLNQRQSAIEDFANLMLQVNHRLNL